MPIRHHKHITHSYCKRCHNITYRQNKKYCIRCNYGKSPKLKNKYKKVMYRLKRKPGRIKYTDARTYKRVMGEKR